MSNLADYSCARKVQNEILGILLSMDPEHFCVTVNWMTCFHVCSLQWLTVYFDYICTSSMT